eukprot:4047525-Pyramimonas_sp.AAC.1
MGYPGRTNSRASSMAQAVVAPIVNARNWALASVAEKRDVSMLNFQGEVPGHWVILALDFDSLRPCSHCLLGFLGVARTRSSRRRGPQGLPRATLGSA